MARSDSTETDRHGMYVRALVSHWISSFGMPLDMAWTGTPQFMSNL